MFKKIKNWLRLSYFKGIVSIYSGKGGIQGMGVDVQAEIIEIKILGITYRRVVNVFFDVQSEWMRKHKIKHIENDDQQKLELNRKENGKR